MAERGAPLVEKEQALATQPTSNYELPPEVEKIQKALSELSEKHSLRTSPFSHFCGKNRNEIIFISYAFGIFSVWIFGAHPEYFPLLYIVFIAITLPLKIYTELKEHGFAKAAWNLELCWMANIVGWLTLMVALCAPPPKEENIFRIILYAGFSGIGSGPVLFANAFLLKNPFVFHDFEKVLTSYVHLTPAFLLYIFRWHTGPDSGIVHIWANKFADTMLNDSVSSVTVLEVSLLFYFGWWVPFTIWLLFFGGRHRHEGFQGLLTKAVLKKQGFHVMGAFVCLAISVLCYSVQVVHRVSLAVNFTLCIYNGATRYRYVILDEALETVHKTLVRHDGQALQHVEEKRRTEAVCVAACEQNPAAREHVPVDLRSKVDKALEKSGLAHCV